jgi:molybdenum transport protein
VKAIKAGGAAIHRFGLSESILIYKDHYKFLGGLNNLDQRIRERKAQTGGKSISVEVDSIEDALLIAKTGIDLIQLNKVSVAEINKLRKEISGNNASVKIAAAGNITLKNVHDFAGSGADILITSWPYYGEPADMLVNIQPIFDTI